MSNTITGRDTSGRQRTIELVEDVRGWLVVECTTAGSLKHHHTCSSRAAAVAAARGVIAVTRQP